MAKEIVTGIKLLLKIIKSNTLFVELVSIFFKEITFIKNRLIPGQETQISCTEHYQAKKKKKRFVISR